jgi:hypothetical protein
VFCFEVYDLCATWRKWVTDTLFEAFFASVENFDESEIVDEVSTDGDIEMEIRLLVTILDTLEVFEIIVISLSVDITEMILLNFDFSPCLSANLAIHLNISAPFCPLSTVGVGHFCGVQVARDDTFSFPTSYMPITISNNILYTLICTCYDL